MLISTTIAAASALAAGSSPASPSTTISHHQHQHQHVTLPKVSRVQGHLLIHIRRGHMLHQGQVFIADENRFHPFFTITFDLGTLTTRALTEQGQELNVDEHFLLQVDHSGHELVYFRAHGNVDGKANCAAMYHVEIGTLISQVGPQWIQWRGAGTFEKAAFGVIEGELLFEFQWFPYRTDVPAEVLTKLSGALLLKERDLKRYGNLLESSFSNALRFDANDAAPSSSATASSSSSSSHSSSKTTTSISTTTSASTSTSTASSTSNYKKTLTKLPSYDDVVVAMSQRLLASGGTGLSSALLLEPVSDDRSFRQLTIPPTPFVFSSPPYGRLLPDSRSFDDRDFLGPFAGISHLYEVMVWGDEAVQAIQAIYKVAGSRLPAPRRGRHNQNVSILTLDDDEYVISMAGRRDHRGIVGLTVVTTKQTRVFGSATFFEMGQDFACTLPEGSRVVCFHGASNASIVNNLGVCYQRIQPVTAFGSRIS